MHNKENGILMIFVQRSLGQGFSLQIKKKMHSLTLEKSKYFRLSTAL